MSKAILDIVDMKATRVFAVGDIHGCYSELLALEKKIKNQIRRSNFHSLKIISVGDLCDRGPNTNAVIAHFAAGKAAGTHELILGNHETFFILAFWGLRKDLVMKAGIKPSWYLEILFRIFRMQTSSIHAWRQNGGRSVFESYGADIDDVDTWDKVPLDHLKLLFEAPLVVRTPKAIISHALMHLGDFEILESLDQGLAVDDKLAEAAVIRCLWERQLADCKLLAGKRHVSGHTPLERVERNLLLGTIQIDTGAVYGGSLTALDIKTFRATQVKSTYSCRSNAG